MVNMIGHGRSVEFYVEPAGESNVVELRPLAASRSVQRQTLLSLLVGHRLVEVFSLGEIGRLLMT